MSRSSLYASVILLLALGACEQKDAALEDSASIWYARHPGEKQGPISREELERNIERKRLPPDVMVWTATTEHWVPSWELIDPLLDFDPPRPDRHGAEFLKLCDRAKRISDRENEILASFVAAIRVEPSTEVRSILVRHFDLLRDARSSMEEVGEIGLDFAQGFELRLPHAGSDRSLARLLAADCRLQVAEGNIQTAVRDCAAIARLARQMAADGIVVSSTVSMSLAVLFADELRHLLDEARLDSATSEIIIESSKWLQGDDPFHLEDAMRVEKVFTVAWAANQLREGKADESFQFPAGTDGDAIRRRLTKESVQTRQAFDVLIAAVAGRRLPDDEALDEIEHRILSGDFGTLASMLVLVSPARQVSDTLRRVDRVIERLASSS